MREEKSKQATFSLIKAINISPVLRDSSSFDRLRTQNDRKNSASE